MDRREKRGWCTKHNRMPRRTRDAVGAHQEGPAATLFSSALRRISSATRARLYTPARFFTETAATGRTDSMKRTTKKPRKTNAREPDLVPEVKQPVGQPAAPP